MRLYAHLIRMNMIDYGENSETGMKLMGLREGIDLLKVLRALSTLPQARAPLLKFLSFLRGPADSIRGNTQ
jgi:hypothetical protein